MKRRHFLTAAAGGTAGLSMLSCAEKKPETPQGKLFSFIHFTDSHVKPEHGAREGFLMAIAAMNALKPDFVIGGGDLISDALEEDEQRSVMLYDMYIECCKKFDCPVHHVLGNHEVFGIYVPDKVPTDHPEWGKEMFKKRLGGGKTYRSFDHNGVHFVLLDSVGIEKKGDGEGFMYFGEAGSEQRDWLKNDLAGIPAGTPVIAVSHIPVLTLYNVVSPSGRAIFKDGGRNLILTDGKELYDCLAAHNFIGYLEGHLHINELYRYKKASVVNTGAVCGAWWEGDRDGHPEGFNIIHVYPDRIENEYRTYGWDASKYMAG